MHILPKISRKSFLSLSLMAALAIGAGCFAADKPKSTKKPGDPDITVQVEMAKGAKEATLIVSAKIPNKFHIYSTRTSDGINGGRATKVTFDKSSPWVMVGNDFTADHAPHPAKEPGLDEGKLDSVEHFEGQVTWRRQIKLKSGTVPPNAVVSGLVKGQMCDDQKCRLFKHAFQAQVKIVQ